MKPRICYSLKDLDEVDEKCLFECFELKYVGRVVKPKMILLLRAKRKLKGKDLSLHSQLGRVFSCREMGFRDFANAELSILKSEIIISKMLGIKEINLHMKEGIFDSWEIKRFNDVIDFAESKGVKLIYENHACSEEVILNVLKIFPRLGFCLDLGHLNIAIHKGIFKLDLEEFIKKVKSRLVHLHAHNNFGEVDEHNSLDEGNFHWRKTLDLLKDGNLRKIIIETNSLQDALKSKKLLENYYY